MTDHKEPEQLELDLQPPRVKFDDFNWLRSSYGIVTYTSTTNTEPSYYNWSLGT